jgi:dTDP-4-dehydrorhamnose 3,5-epimerase
VVAKFCNRGTDLYHPSDKGAWNDSEIGVIRLQMEGDYQGTANAEGYRLENGTRVESY